MDRKSTWLWVSSAATGMVRHEPSPSLRSEPDANPPAGPRRHVDPGAAAVAWAVGADLGGCLGVGSLWVAVSPGVRRHQSTAFGRGAVPSR